MTAINWTALDLVGDNLVTYMFATEMALASAVCIFFLLLLIGAGVDFKYAIIFILPLVGAYTIGGAFGVNVWVLHTVIFVAGIIYSAAIIKIST